MKRRYGAHILKEYQPQYRGCCGFHYARRMGRRGISRLEVVPGRGWPRRP